MTNEPEVPVFDHAGQLTLEPGEKVLRNFQSTMKVFRRPKGKDWLSLEVLESPSTIVLTNRRVVYSWPNWKSDKSGGSFFERRVLSTILEREDGKLLPASHVRHCWIHNVSRNTKMEGTFKKRAVSKTYFKFDTREESFEIDFTGLEVSQADALAEAIAEAVALERLERRGSANKPLTDEKSSQLAAISKREGSTYDGPDFRNFYTPGEMIAPFDYESD